MSDATTIILWIIVCVVLSALVGKEVQEERLSIFRKRAGGPRPKEG